LILKKEEKLQQVVFIAPKVEAAEGKQSKTKAAPK
jgi:hypothetical protein